MNQQYENVENMLKGWFVNVKEFTNSKCGLWSVWRTGVMPRGGVKITLRLLCVYEFGFCCKLW